MPRSGRAFPPPLQALLLWQVWTLCWVCGLLASRWSGPALTGLLLIFLADSRLHRPGRLLAALLLCGAGWATATLSQPQRPDAPPTWARTARNAPLPRLIGTIHEVQGLPDQRLRLLLRDVRPAGDAKAPPLPGLVAWTWEQPLLRPDAGQQVEVTLRVRSSRGFRNPGVADFGQWWETRGVFWRVWSRGERGDPRVTGNPSTASALRDRLRRRLDKALEAADPRPQERAVIPALLFGDRYHLASTTMQRMAQATLVHSLALSGQHLAVAGLLGALLACGVGYVRPTVFLCLPRPKLILLLALPPAALYLWLGNAPGSLVRAACMLGLLALWQRQDTPRTLADLLLGAVLGITLAAPLSVFDTGMQLSVLCVAAIALAVPLLRRLPLPVPKVSDPPLQRYGIRLFRGAAQILCTSLLIQMALLPVSLLLFHTASPWFFLNVLWLPIVDGWVLPLSAVGLAFAALGADTAAHWVLELALPPCRWLLLFLDWLATHGLLDMPALLRPHWTTVPAFAALLAALALLPGRGCLPPAGRRLAVAGMALLAVGPLLRYGAELDDGITLALLDVGQGQAVALELPGGARLLVDGGGSNSPRFDPGRDLVAPALTYNRSPRLEMIFNSHPDADHLRGLLHILQTFSVGEYLHNAEPPHPAEAETMARILKRLPHRTLAAGDVISLPSGGGPPLRLEVLHPPPGAVVGNDGSLTLRLVQGNHGLAVLPGDLECSGLRALLSSGRDLRADVLVAPHHGSGRSLLPELYDAVKPKLVLASCGAENRYGYPSEKLVRLLHKKSVPLMSTADFGRIRVRWDTKTDFPLIRTERPLSINAE